MATLKQAVESGRRWRHRGWSGAMWGTGLISPTLSPEEALSSNFEIEPENHTAWKVHRCTDGSIESCETPEGQRCDYGRDFYVVETNLSDAEFHEPEPEKPEEFVLNPHGEWYRLCAGQPLVKGDQRVRDADACDRIHFKEEVQNLGKLIYGGDENARK